MAEYSSVDLAAATAILDRFGRRAVDVHRLPGGAANSSFRVRTTTTDVVLTVLDNHTHASAGDLVALVEHLVASGIDVPLPLRDREGRRVVAHGGRPVVVKPYVAGRLLEDADVEDLGGVGNLLASVHLVPAPRRPRLGRRRLPADWRQVLSTRPQAQLEAEIGEAVAATDLLWREMPAGLIHGDFFGDNLVKTDAVGSIVPLDWETAALDALVLDIAICAVALCAVGGRLDAERLDVLLRSYSEVRSLTPAERAALPAFVGYAAVLLAYHRYVRHNIRYPNEAQAESYVEMLELARAVSTAT